MAGANKDIVPAKQENKKDTNDRTDGEIWEWLAESHDILPERREDNKTDRKNRKTWGWLAVQRRRDISRARC